MRATRSLAGLWRCWPLALVSLQSHDPLVLWLASVAHEQVTITTLLANPAPKTHTPEWKKATEEYLRKQNANPIGGISSKHAADLEKVKVE